MNPEKKTLKAIGQHYKLRRVAELLDMSTKWVRKQIEAGDLESYRFGKDIVVPARSLDRFLFSRKINGDDVKIGCNL